MDAHGLGENLALETRTVTHDQGPDVNITGSPSEYHVESNDETSTNEDVLPSSDSCEQRRPSFRATPLSFNYSTIYEEDELSKPNSLRSKDSPKIPSAADDIGIVKHHSPDSIKADIQEQTIGQNGANRIDGETNENHTVLQHDVSEDGATPSSGTGTEVFSRNYSQLSRNSSPSEISDNMSSVRSSRPSSRAKSITPKPCSIEQFEEAAKALSSSSLRCISPSPRQPKLQILRDILQFESTDQQTVSEYSVSRRSSRQSGVEISELKTKTTKDTNVRGSSEVSLSHISALSEEVDTRDRYHTKENALSVLESVGKNPKVVRNDHDSVSSVSHQLPLGKRNPGSSNNISDVEINEIRDKKRDTQDYPYEESLENKHISGYKDPDDFVKRQHSRRTHNHQQVYKTLRTEGTESRTKEAKATTTIPKQSASATNGRSAVDIEYTKSRTADLTDRKGDETEPLSEQANSLVYDGEGSERPGTGYHTRPDTGYHSAKTQRGKKISETSMKSSKSDTTSLCSMTSVSHLDVNWLYKQLQTSLQKLRRDCDTRSKSKQSKEDVYATLKILTDLLKFSERTKSIVGDLRSELNNICQRKDSDSIKVDNLSILEENNLDQNVEKAIRLTDKILDVLSQTGVVVNDSRDAISPVLIRSQLTSAFSFDTSLVEGDRFEPDLTEIVGIDQETEESDIETGFCFNREEILSLSLSQTTGDNHETLSISEHSQNADQFSLRSATLSPGSFFETEEAVVDEYIMEDNHSIGGSTELPEKFSDETGSLDCLNTFEESHDILESYSDWSQKIFYGLNIDGTKELSCIVRCKSKGVDLNKIQCETLHAYNPSPLSDFEILRSNIVYLAYDGQLSSKDEFRIALPVMERGLEAWEEIVFKEMSGDKWKARKGHSRLFTGIINEEFNVVEMKTYHIRPVALVSRPIAQHLTHNYLRVDLSDDEFSSASAPAYMTSEIDTNITIDVLASDLEGTGDVSMQVVPIESSLFTKWKKNNEDNSIIIAASSLIIIEQLREPVNQLLLTVPLTYPHGAVTYSSTARFKPPTQVQFVRIRPRSDIRLVSCDNEFVKGGTEKISVKFDDKLVSFLAVKTRNDIPTFEITPIVESLLQFLKKRVFRLSVKVEDYRENTAKLKGTIQGYRASKYLHTGHEETKRTKEIRVLEGSNLEFKFRGNIDIECEQSLVCSAKFAQDVTFTADIKVLDVFAQKTLKMYSGFMQIYVQCSSNASIRARSPRSVTPKDGYSEILPAVPEATRHLIAEFDITLPKDNAKMQRQYQPLKTELKSEGPVNEFYLKRLGYELCNEWEVLVTWLGIPKARIQAILCHNKNIVDGQFVFYLLINWFKKLPKAANKAEVLMKVLQQCNRHDLADRLEELNESHKADITRKARETNITKTVHCLCKEEAVHMHWVSLAYFLGLKDSEIKKIEIEYRRQEDKKCEKMINGWLNFDNIEYNVAKLGLGLKLIGCNTAAEYLITNMCETGVVTKRCKINYNRTVLNNIEAI